ncbi:hypothetical protein AXF42_Ash016960 [Apostasia shenzhenica]|uniref:Uncharacterized protein n=1 Tax=Apostasia shenzhenica TaxID=1088818 RepID=A0A2H9ZRL1_9ASPA|nr:hypothetical protein AXF42_Ash016960 [Apostasia shenzhenica]
MAAVGCRGEKPWTPPFCTVVQAETSSFSYLVCSICERPLPDDPNLNPPPPCAVCAKRNPFSSAPSKRLYRLIVIPDLLPSLSLPDPLIASDRILSADLCCCRGYGDAGDMLRPGGADSNRLLRRRPLQLLQGSSLRRSEDSAEKMGEMLEGEMCQMTICEPKSGNAQHLRAVSIVPLRTGFRPVIHALRRFYDVAGPNQSSA